MGVGGMCIHKHTHTHKHTFASKVPIHMNSWGKTVQFVLIKQTARNDKECYNSTNFP